MRTLDVEAGPTRYTITIGPALIGDPHACAARIPGRDHLVVTNETVAPLYLDKLRAGLPGRRVQACVLPDGERFKTLATLERVFDALTAHRFNRDAVVIALGGGVVGDMAGFAAACYQRGVGYVQVPTTLLAQVDSSVGGKTGVNLPAGKNLVGAFHQPLAVIADTDTLATLPPRELRAGLAEVIKYGCICDVGFLDWIETRLEALLACDAAALTEAIERSCAIKARVVGEDEREHGLRAILNFGHTFGHAIEAATGYETLLHGEAVALGMLCAADLSCRIGMLEPAAAARIGALLTRAGLPTVTPRIGAARAAELLRLDKKVLAGKVRLVLLDGLGRAVVSDAYPQDALGAVLEERFA